MAAEGSELLSYHADSTVYAIGWSQSRRCKNTFRLGVGSFKEEWNTNYVEIIHLDEEKGQLVRDPALTFGHDYPPTKLMFIPDLDHSCQPDLMATTGEFLRLWRIEEDGVRLERLLNNNKQSDFCAPLTSFDWCDADPKYLGTSSVDTTCTIWDIERGVVDTQLIAHDKEVYDIAWGGWGVFATVSADGSVRVFDLRDKSQSTVIYECPQPNTPLLRLSWNKQDPRYMATVVMDSSKVIVLDIRYPSLPITELTRHQAPVNGVAWAPHSSAHLCTAGDDAQCMIWDMATMSQGADKPDLDPVLAYGANGPINSLCWSCLSPDFVAIASGSMVQALRV